MSNKCSSYKGEKMNSLYYNEKEKEKIEKRIFYANNLEYKESGSEESDSSLEESAVQSKGTSARPGYLHRLWDRGGPVKLYSPPGDGAFTITFNNYKRLKYIELSGFLKEFGQFLSIRELDGNFVRVRFEREEEIRKCYRSLIKDHKYQVTVLLDIEEYKELRKKEKKRCVLDTFRQNNIFAEREEREDLKEQPESDPMFEKALQIEAGIGFGLSSGQHSKKENDSDGDKEEKPRNHRVGTWNGNFVVEPEHPFVNKHLNPPPSYLKWKCSSSGKFLISADDSRPHNKGKCAFEKRITDLNPGVTNVLSKPLMKSVEVREADSSISICERIPHRQDVSRKVQANVPQILPSNGLNIQKNAASSAISRYNTPKMEEYFPSPDSTNRRSGSDLDSTSQTYCEEIISKFPPSDESFDSEQHFQNGFKYSVHSSSKSPNSSYCRERNRRNGDEQKRRSDNKLNSASELVAEKEETSGHNNSNKHSTPRISGGYDFSNEDRSTLPNSPTLFNRSKAYNNQKYLYQFSVQSSEPDALFNSSWCSESSPGEETNSSSTGMERLQYINKNDKNRQNHFNKGQHKLSDSSSENMGLENSFSSYNYSGNNTTRDRKSVNEYNEQTPPLISIFDLYAFWLRKSVFEMI